MKRSHSGEFDLLRFTVRSIFCGLVLLLGVCTLSVECAESVAKNPPSLSDASEAGMAAGKEVFSLGQDKSRIREISSALGYA